MANCSSDGRILQSALVGPVKAKISAELSFRVAISSFHPCRVTMSVCAFERLLSVGDQRYHRCTDSLPGS